MNLAAFRRRAKKNDLEVEHLLGLASTRPDGLADELEKLIIECEWDDGRQLTPHTRTLPWRRWARTAIAYTRDGYDGLAKLVAADAAYHNFALALLEKIRTHESLDAALRIDAAVIANPAAHLDQADKLARTIDAHLSFPPPLTIAPDSATAVRIRDFLHRHLAVCKTTVQRANALCALRGVGDAATLELIAAQPPLEDPWQGVLKAVQRDIRKRLANPVAQTAKSASENPNGVPSYSPGLPESARATLGNDEKTRTTPTGLPPTKSPPPKKTATTSKPAPAKTIVHDKAKWHHDADDFPSDLPPEAGATHIAFYLRWCLENDQLSDEFLETYPAELAAIRAAANNNTLAAHDMRDLLINDLDGVFTSDILNAEGRAFARAYYDTDTTPFARKYRTYPEDYEALARESSLKPSYRLPNDAATYARMKKIIDARYRQFQALRA